MSARTTTVVTALDTSQVKNLSIVAIAAVVLIGLLIARLVTKVVTRIIVLVVVVVLGFALYNQRAKVVDAADEAAKKCEATFFGIHVQPSDENIKKACAEAAKLKKK
jgi:hypothetical protein